MGCVVVGGDGGAFWIARSVAAVTIVTGEVGKREENDGGVVGAFAADVGKAEMVGVRRLDAGHETAVICAA